MQTRAKIICGRQKSPAMAMGGIRAKKRRQILGILMKLGGRVEEGSGRIRVNWRYHLLQLQLLTLMPRLLLEHLLIYILDGDLHIHREGISHVPSHNLDSAREMKLRWNTEGGQEVPHLRTLQVRPAAQTIRYSRHILEVIYRLCERDQRVVPVPRSLRNLIMDELRLAIRFVLKT